MVTVCVQYMMYTWRAVITTSRVHSVYHAFTDWYVIGILACTYGKMSTSMVAIAACNFLSSLPCQTVNPCKQVPLCVPKQISLGAQVQQSCRPWCRATTSSPSTRKICVEMLLGLYAKWGGAPLAETIYHGEQPVAYLKVALVELLTGTCNTQVHWGIGGVGMA
jgi:hypothetical protein